MCGLQVMQKQLRYFSGSYAARRQATVNIGIHAAHPIVSHHEEFPDPLCHRLIHVETLCSSRADIVMHEPMAGDLNNSYRAANIMDSRPTVEANTTEARARENSGYSSTPCRIVIF